MITSKALAERLAVAADFRPEDGHGREWARREVLGLAKKLRGTGVYLKVNSALRAEGYRLVEEIREWELKVFADLKLFDIHHTLFTDGVLLHEVKPELLTVMCMAGISSLQALKIELPETEILGVTTLTSMKDSDTQRMFGCSVEESVMRFAQIAVDAKVDGLVCAPAEAAMLRQKFSEKLSLNTPDVRPTWAHVRGDDQNYRRVMTPAEAITAGATRLVVGRPITQAKNPYDAVMRILEEIASTIS